jgi:hypothetical protein
LASIAKCSFTAWGRSLSMFSKIGSMCSIAGYQQLQPD